MGFGSYVKIDGGGRTSRGIIYDGDGKGKVKAKAQAAVTKGYVYKMAYDETGREAEAMSGTAAFYAMMGIAEKSLSTGEYGWFIVEGPATLVTASAASLGTAVGYAVKVHDGAVAATAAAWDDSANNEFAVLRAVSASATSHSVYMVPKIILSTT